MEGVYCQVPPGAGVACYEALHGLHSDLHAAVGVRMVGRGDPVVYIPILEEGFGEVGGEFRSAVCCDGVGDTIGGKRVSEDRDESLCSLFGGCDNWPV